MQALLERFVDVGLVFSELRVGRERGEVHSFRMADRRLLFFFDGSDVVVTHGCAAPSGLPAVAELDAADALRAEYLLWCETGGDEAGSEGA